MATVTMQICDMCSETQTVAVEKRRIQQLDGALEVDLCTEHDQEWQRIEAVRQVFVDVARPATADPPAAEPGPAPAEQEKKPRAARQRNDAHAEENREIRAWARQAGIEMGDRGRISESTRKQYREWRWQQDHPVPPPVQPVTVFPRAVPRPPAHPPTPTPLANGKDEGRAFGVDEAMAAYSD